MKTFFAEIIDSDKNTRIELKARDLEDAKEYALAWIEYLQESPSPTNGEWQTAPSSEDKHVLVLRSGRKLQMGEVKKEID